jgi:hypothetical protein
MNQLLMDRSDGMCFLLPFSPLVIIEVERRQMTRHHPATSLIFDFDNIKIMECLIAILSFRLFLAIVSVNKQEE